VTALTIIAGFTTVWLEYNPTTNKWLIVLGQETPYKTEVWESSNGTSWTKIATLTATQVRYAVPFGNMWVGLAKRSPSLQIEVVYSLDGGITWLLAGVRPTNGGNSIHTSPDQVLITDGADTIYLSHRMGKPDYGQCT
jgi:hypothetical protein